MLGEWTEDSATGHPYLFHAPLLWSWWDHQEGSANQMAHGVELSQAALVSWC